MSDLSRLLDDVYGSPPPSPTTPSWVTEAAEVFSGLEPAATPPEPPRPESVLDPAQALEAILALGLTEPATERASEPAFEPGIEPALELPPLVLGRPWVPADDDILPTKAARRPLRLRRR